MRFFGRSVFLRLSLILLLAGCAAPKQPPRESGRAVSKPDEPQKERVTGVGGVFFKARNPKQLAAWYDEHLGIQTRNGYTDFKWREKDHPDQIGRTVWSLFPTNSTHFASPLMINYRVANLDRMLEQLRRGGVMVEKVENASYGRFAWIMDPEGNRVELWEPVKE
jgi:predicted enzyme related to lactoylglutathione lyase